MNIWLKEISLDDDKTYFDLLMELSSYKDAFARPVPRDFSFDEFENFKQIRIKMKSGEGLPKSVMPTTTYWVMLNDVAIGYATLKHKINPDIPGGHFGCCLKKKYQNKGIGGMVAEQLSVIAYEELGIEEVIYTSKNENIQSQKSVDKIGGTLVSVHDGYHFYVVDLKEKFSKEGRNIK